MFYSEEPYQYERIKNFIPCRIGMNEKIDLFADTELGGGAANRRSCFDTGFLVGRSKFDDIFTEEILVQR